MVHGYGMAYEGTLVSGIWETWPHPMLPQLCAFDPGGPSAGSSMLISSGCRGLGWG